MFRAAVVLTLLPGMLCLQQVRAADVGDAAGQASSVQLFKQAVAYEHAEGVAKNYVKAAELYCTATRMGNADAAFNLGWMYANARGLERDDGIAVALFRRAADQGHPTAGQVLQKIHSSDVHLPGCLQATVPAVAAPAVPAKAGEPKRANSDAKTDVNAQAASALIAEQREVADALTEWAAAWSRKDVDGYQAAYASDFAVPNGKTMQQWKEERSARILDKAWIAVKIYDMDISVDGTKAEARFHQDYRSDKLNELSLKVFTLAKVDQKWLIRQELTKK
jgi:TPR repeat protein